MVQNVTKNFSSYISKALEQNPVNFEVVEISYSEKLLFLQLAYEKSQRDSLLSSNSEDDNKDKLV